MNQCHSERSEESHPVAVAFMRLVVAKLALPYGSEESLTIFIGKKDLTRDNIICYIRFGGEKYEHINLYKGTTSRRSQTKG